MASELSEIKKIRVKLGLTQSELAVHANVSQSLIAKIEAGRLDPGYSRTKQIFDALDEMTRKKELNAAEIMTKKVVTISTYSNLHSVVQLMKKHAISQLPVVDKGKPVGIITEGAIIDKVGSGGDIKEMKASEVMEECPPTISSATHMSAVTGLLRYFSVVLVVDKGVIKGIISKADLIEKIV